MLTRLLQICHLFLIFVLPILYALFRLSAGESGEWRTAIDGAAVLAAAIWLGIIFVRVARIGSEEGLKKAFIEAYRRLLSAKRFLVLSNLVLVCINCMLLYQLLFFRQVPFYCTTDVELVVNDHSGSVESLGILKANTQTNFRLRVGRRAMVIRDITTRQPLQSNYLDVPAVWEKVSPDVVLLQLKQARQYEKTN